MNYAATRFENDGEYSEVLEAATWAEAEEICVAQDSLSFENYLDPSF